MTPVATQLLTEQSSVKKIKSSFSKLQISYPSLKLYNIYPSNSRGDQFNYFHLSFSPFCIVGLEDIEINS